MYKPNNREELQSMLSSTFKSLRSQKKAEKVNPQMTDELDFPVHNVVWMDELRSNPILPVDSTFLVCLYRHF